MRIAVTGASGGIGRAVVSRALDAGHDVVAIDKTAPRSADIRVIAADAADYDALAAAFAGCDALIHLAAIPDPTGRADHEVHANNVLSSYNAMRAAIACGIRRICQASSVNALGLSFSRAPRFDWFPLDETHPTYAEDPYSLSKWIAEQQADALARRYANLAVASLRFHYVVDDVTQAAARYDGLVPEKAKHLWGYTLRGPAAEACVRALKAPFTGHEAFYVTAPDTCSALPSRDLAARCHPDVPIRGALEGRASFFDTAKARSVLGWDHPSVENAGRAPPPPDP